MAAIVAGIAAAVQYSGLAAVPGNLAYADAATPVQFYGLPAVLPVSAPAPSSSPDAVRARVLDSAGSFICHLPHVEGLRWRDEGNTAGAGSVDYHRYDDVEAAHPGMWAAGHQIMIAVGGLDVFRLVLDAEGGYRIDSATGQRVDSWSGNGALGVLNSG